MLPSGRVQMDRRKVRDRQVGGRGRGECCNDLDVALATRTGLDVFRLVPSLGEKVLSRAMIIISAMNAGQSLIFPVRSAEAAAQMQGLPVPLKFSEDRERSTHQTGTFAPGDTG